MRVSKAQSAETRERILRTAGRLFREKGFEGVGVAEIMAAAGLTNGAFYRHFDSKDDLVAKTCERVMAGAKDPWEALIDDEISLPDFLDRYLSTAHARARGEGCQFAALGGEVARQAEPARLAFTDNLVASLEALTPRMEGEVAFEQHQMALKTLATMVGGLMLARAVMDPELSQALLSAARAAVGTAARQQIAH
jgi:TetR/AcrR family transcriptional repressor of nem operon